MIMFSCDCEPGHWTGKLFAGYARDVETVVDEAEELQEFGSAVAARVRPVEQ